MNLFNVNKFELTKLQDPIKEISGIVRNDIKSIPLAIKNSSIAFINELIMKSKSDYEAKGRKSSSNFLNTLRKSEVYTKDKDIQNIRVDVVSDAFRNSAKYGNFHYGVALEYGARAISAMSKNLVSGLKEWVEKKNIIFTNRETGRQFTANQTAYVIARSLMKKSKTADYIFNTNADMLNLDGKIENNLESVL